MSTYILRVSSADRPGIVASVSGYLYEQGFNVEDASQFNDHLSDRFYMRVVFCIADDDADIEGFKQGFEHIAQKFEIEWSVYPAEEKVKAILMVSKEDHCLEDIWYRVRTNQLPIEIMAVVSNHEVCREQVEGRGIRFEYMPVTSDTKAQQEENLAGLIEETQSELVVMARYMQILTNDFCNRYVGRIINIHHSFLPWFKGAKPYHQAWERGVKLIGATAHYATADLDEGPIIEQETARISHKMTPDKLHLMGKDIEAHVLSRALSYYAERRIFLFDGRTIIL
ncbi:MAG: formyltetrahydrofolate deformylase [Alphaproteobacteria bacterium]